MSKINGFLRLRNSKRWLIVGLFALVVLTGCSTEPQLEADTPTASATTTSAPTRTVSPTPEFTPTPTQPVGLTVDPDDLEGVVIRFVHPWVGEPADTLESVAREFSLTNPWGIRVEVYPHGGEMVLVEALQAAEASGEMPDLIAAQPYLRSMMIAEDGLADVSVYIDDPRWGFSPDEREDIMPVFLEAFTIEEQMVALPLAPQATVLFYNRTWGEALGFTELPRELATFRRQTCDATFANWQDDNQPGRTGGWVINLDPWVLASWYYAFEGTLPAADVPAFNNEAGRDAFGYLWDLKNQGCIWFALQPDSYAYFANRHALIYAGQLDQIPMQMNWMDATGSEDEWEVLGFPGPAGERILIDGPGLMIVRDMPEQELAAWLFSKYLLEPKVQVQLVKSMFSLPVRESAMDLLADFEAEYPQWAQGAALLDSASVLPASEYWPMAQWVLQDGVNRILQDESGNVNLLLEQMDALIVDLVGSTP